MATSFVAGCSSSNSSKTGQSSAAIVLDPTQQHYGQTDDEWGALWWKWIYELPQTDANNCVIPYLDPTGANCGVGQSGDVFFLAGTEGATVVRDQCTVPSGKALFFPILSFSADNAGVPAAMQLADADLMTYVQGQLDAIQVSTLSADFDGVAITDMARFRTKITKFSYTLPPEPNVYTCQGQPGVTGLVDPSFAAGYYIMLAPPSPGSHKLHFAGSSPPPMPMAPAVMVDVTYHLTVK